MCGLVGIASVRQCADSKRSWLIDAQDCLSYRGPDDEGIWWSLDSRVGLAHRRLSILDLTEAGHQPMHLQNAGLTIVFNGEIYNFTEIRENLRQKGHCFHSASDTEVLLAAYAEWGVECLSHLNGMFAFALFDSIRGRIFIARDRVGEKPLFYRLEKGVLLFASELKALLKDSSLPRIIKRNSLEDYLSNGFVHGGDCILEGFHKLPPAHALVFDINGGSHNIWQYWQPPSLVMPEYNFNEVTLLDELESLLEDAVRRQLVADVPVGVLLSGGVDSSLITALAVRSSSNVHTFSIGFPGHPKNDETHHARLIAEFFGTKHTELMAEPATADLVLKLAKQFDEPIADSSMIPSLLVSRLVRQQCTVALGGDGGDELFGGYGHYSSLLKMQKNFGWMPRVVKRGVSLAAENYLPIGFKGRHFLQQAGTNLQNDWPLFPNYFDSKTIDQLLQRHTGQRSILMHAYKTRHERGMDLVQRATRADFENYLPEDILVKVDRTSMLESLEIRAPMLDYRVVEFAYSRVPSYLKATTTDKKILLKKLSCRLLPSGFDRKRKQGFSIPLAQWLKGGQYRDLLWDVLSRQDCLFDRKTVDGILDGQDRGRSNSERIFALAIFELWRNEYKATL